MEWGERKDWLADWINRKISPHVGKFLLTTLVLAAILILVKHRWIDHVLEDYVYQERWMPIRNSIGLLVVIFLAYYAAFVNRKNKILDVIIHCTSRYDMIAQEKAKIVNDGNLPQARAYFQRYWSLKSDQLDYWMMGCVDSETIVSWFFQVLESFEKELEGGIEGKPYVWPFMTYSQGWEETNSTHQRLNPRLCQIVAEIKKLVLPGQNPDERLFALIEILRRAEVQERRYIRFTEVNFFFFLPLRGRRMSSYALMEKKRRSRLGREFRSIPTMEAKVVSLSSFTSLDDR